MKLLVAGLCSVALLVAACGSDSDGDTAPNTTPSTASTSTAAPQSTTTVAAPPTTAAPITVATVAPTATETTPATDPPETDPPETEPTEPDTTASTPETADTNDSGDSTDPPTTTRSPVGQYTEVPPPSVPTVSAEVRADNTHPDGVYYATVTEGGDPPPAAGEVVFELVQLFRGEECTKHFGEDDEDSCVNDYGVDTDPTAALAVPLTDQFISVADAATQKSLEITGAELYALIHGDEPSAGAPDGYMYVGFGYFLTISGGEVTRLEQWWTP